jgi:hypothetical protein
MWSIDVLQRNIARRGTCRLPSINDRLRLSAISGLRNAVAHTPIDLVSPPQ